MFVAAAGNYYAVAIYLFILLGGLEGQCHLGPWRERAGTAKLDAILVKND